MTSEAITDAWVFVDGLQDNPVLCGRFHLDSQRQVGRFVYGKSWLARPDAFALDPLSLPLTESVMTTRVNKGVFGVLADAGPDAWGRRLMLTLHTTKPRNALEELLAGAGYGVGALMLSLSRNSAKTKTSPNRIDSLAALVRGKDELLSDIDLPNEVRQAFLSGQSLGGARPKTQVIDGETVYLAKFNRPDDLFNMARAEHAAMTLASEVGIEVAQTHIKSTPHGDVLLVKRFDLQSNRPNHHFLSANSLFNKRSVNERDLATGYSYGALADFIRHKTAQPKQATELYKRMVFNAFIGNTDDHARNHALLYSFGSQQWRLSPAYDITPVNNTQIHGIGIGEKGRIANQDNLLSQAVRFGLRQADAKKIIQQIQEAVTDWPLHFKRSADVSDADLERLKGVIPPGI